MSDTLTTLLTTVGGAYLGKFVGPAAEAMGKAAWERAQQLGQKATALLTAVGREPQPVEPKLLVPLVQAASLETDEALATRWAALLANAADPAQRVAVQPAFAEVLRQLTPTDAAVLDALYFSNIAPPGIAVTGTRMIKQIMSDTSFSFSEVSLSVDNLLRLRLCMAALNDSKVIPGVHFSTPGEIAATVLGTSFLSAVTPPHSHPPFSP